MVKTLAIETSCDDTSLAIISYEGETFNVEKLLAYSQIADHQKYGGVLPEIASRLHSEKIIAILQNLGRDTISQVDFISVTTHPGLPGSLVVGKAVATTLAEYFHKPLVEVNHIDGHIFSILLERKLTDISFPMVILTASGGHNDIYLVPPLQKGGSPDLVGMGGSNITKTPNGLPPTKERSCSRTSPLDPIPSDTPPVRQDETKSKGGRRHIQKLAYSLDDASGEAFDKVSKMLG